MENKQGYKRQKKTELARSIKWTARTLLTTRKNKYHIHIPSLDILLRRLVLPWTIIYSHSDICYMSDISMSLDIRQEKNNFDIEYFQFWRDYEKWTYPVSQSVKYSSLVVLIVVWWRSGCSIDEILLVLLDKTVEQRMEFANGWTTN